VKVHRQEYYAIIEHLDTQVGRILDTLEKSGQADNTYIFFSADHGLAVGHHGLFGKQNLYEHSTRVPFIAVGPGIATGAKNDAPIYLQDVHPTTLELAGAKPAAKVEFHSLLPMLKGKSKKHAYDAIHGAYLGLQRSVTVDGWKLILYPNVSKARLYNINADPLEMNDLANAVGQSKRISTLFARMLQLQKEMGDKVDLKKSFPKL
jgi:choline-sulfatase